jgi:fucose permease
MRMLVLAAADLCVASAVAVGLWLVFGVFSRFESNPPICSNAFGGTIDCSLDTPSRVAQLVVFGIVLLVLLTLHAIRGRRMRVWPESTIG